MDAGSPQHHVYCSCGAVLHAKSQPAVAATMLVDWFLTKHTGPGHALTDSAGASRGRQRQERINDRAYAILGSGEDSDGR